MAKPPAASRSPKPKTKSPKSKAQDAAAETKSDVKSDVVKATPATETTKPLAPPPRPGQQQSGTTPDFFAAQSNGGSLSLEPNPFEQSFGAPAPETPGGTKLPSVASLTSPSSLLPGGTSTPFNWGPGSLRTGPLSPAMLSAPANDYFSETHHLRGSFPTPNESSLRTGLTPGGSGSMFPAPSPNSQALFALQSGGATPSTIDFHRAALSAASAAKADQAPRTIPNGAATSKGEAKQFDNHDNDAANGLFMLAQGQTRATSSDRFAVQPASQGHAHPAPSGNNTSPQMNGASSIASGSMRGVSEAGSAASEESEPPRPNTRGRKRPSNADSAPASGRRKAGETAAKPPPNKKAKTNGAAAGNAGLMKVEAEEPSDDDDDDMKDENGQGKSKMTDEDKRKNFLERNRVAALKCRQRKKAWLASLQAKVEAYTSENDNLNAQIASLREEVVNLKTLLLAHKDCPVALQQGIPQYNAQPGMDQFNTQMNPYGMAAPMQAQPLIQASVGGRRFS